MNRYGPLVTRPPSVGFAAKWKLRRPKVSRAHTRSSSARIVCCAVFYYRLGEHEYDSGWLLAWGSVMLWLVGSYAFRLGWLGNLLLQVKLFFALTFWNMSRRQGK